MGNICLFLYIYIYILSKVIISFYKVNVVTSTIMPIIYYFSQSSPDKLIK